MANPTIAAASLDEPLDVFGQNVRLSRLYTPLCFCFPLSDTSTDAQSAVIASLTKALEVLSASFPWIAGQVIQDDANIFRIKPYGKTPHLAVRDLRRRLPSMDEIRLAGFPFSVLDEETLAPRGTMPEKFHEPAPVFLLQANFIERGLLLVVMGQHNCMDMAGLCQVIRLLSRACMGDPFIADELRIGNLPRLDIIPVAPEEKSVQPSRPSPAPSSTNPSLPSATDPSPITWAYLSFSQSSISSLKTLATRTITLPFISTDDALSALLWQALTRARLPRFPSTSTSTFQRQVDARPYLGLSAHYPGMAVITASTPRTVDEILHSPIGVLASWLRSALEPDALVRQATAAARAASQGVGSVRLSSSEGAGRRSALAPLEIKMSSWAKEKCNEFSFGPGLETAEVVRRPAFEAWEGLAYLMPKGRDGEVVAAVCVCEEDWERLRGDGEMAKFARFIG